MNRGFTLARDNQFLVINHKPEARFRASRTSHWKKIARQALAEDFESFRKQRKTKKERRATKRKIKMALPKEREEERPGTAEA